MKNNKIAHIGLSVALAASLGCFGIVASGCSQPQEEAPAAEQKAEQGYKVRVNAEGWDEATSTPVVLVAQQLDGKVLKFGERTFEDAAALEAWAATEEGKSAEGEVIEVDKTIGDPHYFSVVANQDVSLDLDAADYAISLLSPVNADGSLYAVPETAYVTVGDLADADAEPLQLTLIPAAEVTAEQIASIIEALSLVHAADGAAVSQEVIERARKNAEACPNVTVEQIEQAAERAEQAVANGGDANSVSNAVNNASGTTSPVRPSTNQPNASAPSNNGGSAGGNATNQPSAPSQPVQQPSQPSTPSHTHDYTIPITEQVWVADKDTIVCSCGETFTSQTAWSAHAKAAGRGESHAYSVETSGHYETKTTGFKCSCGAEQ